MITEAAIFLKDELSRYLLLAGVVLQKDDVFLGNISTFQTHNTQNGKVVISLVNIEEESTQKNVKNPININLKSLAPPLNLSLYFLFTATLPTSEEKKLNNDYQDALNRISTIIEFFQVKPILNLQNSAGFSPTNLREAKTEMRLVSELFKLNFEQINHLWGSLSGNQPPFVLYKIKCEKINS